MSDDFREKIRSLNFGMPSKRQEPKKSIVDTGAAKAELTEHWDDRVDVTIMPEPVRNKASVPEVGS